jgi:hypothetical protein
MHDMSEVFFFLATVTADRRPPSLLRRMKDRYIWQLHGHANIDGSEGGAGLDVIRDSDD